MIYPLVRKSKETCQQAITSNVIAKHFPLLNKFKAYYKEKKQLPILKTEKIVQTRIVHNSHVLSICLRSINTDVTTLLPQEIQQFQTCVNNTLVIHL